MYSAPCLGSLISEYLRRLSTAWSPSFENRALGPKKRNIITVYFKKSVINVNGFSMLVEIRIDIYGHVNFVAIKKANNEAYLFQYYAREVPRVSF